MTETFTVRFQEYQWWDVAEDKEVCRLSATTNIGTWTSIVPVTTAKDMRECREAFKTYVLSAMSLGQPPHEVNISG